MNYESQQTFAYERKENSVVIWRCFSLDTKVEIPETIEGLPVVWIAPYAFSAHMKANEVEQGLASGKLKLYVPPLGDANAPAVCGSQLEEIVFPHTVIHVGRYCFYNCDKLRALTFYGTLSDWGSGAFTGVHHVKEMTVYTDKEQKSYLPEVLQELPEESEVHFHIQQPDGSFKQAEILFTEFYEEGIENTPARILEVRYHGSGLRFRNCFKNRKFEFSSYDGFFEHAVFLEKPSIVARLVLKRLRFPYELSDHARNQYETYLQEHYCDMGDYLIAKDDLDDIKWLLEMMKAEEKKRNALLEHLIALASKEHKTEIMSYLMNYRKEETAPVKKRKRFEL